MDLHLDEEQELIQKSAASFLAKESPVARLHQDEDAFAPAMRAKFAALGWLGMTLPEGAGGVGYSVVEEMLFFRECGRQLAACGVLPAVLAGHVCHEAGDNAGASAFAAGECGAFLAHPGEGAAILDGQVRGAFRLFGSRDAHHALWVHESGAVLFDVAGQKLDWRMSLDKSTPVAVLRCGGAPIVAMTETARAKRVGRLLLAAFLQGASEAIRDMIVEYAKIRHTFGRPIGAYQAVRHPCAEMALRSEQARCQLFVAALALRGARADVDLQIDAAKVVASAAALKNADANIQLHGGIGVTDEHDAHLYLKRVQMMSRWLGGEKILLRRLVDGVAVEASAPA